MRKKGGKIKEKIDDQFFGLLDVTYRRSKQKILTVQMV